MVPTPAKTFVEAAKRWKAYQPNLDILLTKWSEDTTIYDLEMCMDTLTSLRVAGGICREILKEAKQAIEHMDDKVPCQSHEDSSNSSSAHSLTGGVITPRQKHISDSMENRLTVSLSNMMNLEQELNEIRGKLKSVATFMTEMCCRIRPITSALKNAHIAAQAGYSLGMTDQVEPKKTGNKEIKTPALSSNLFQWTDRVHDAKLTVPEAHHTASCSRHETQQNYMSNNIGNMWVGYDVLQDNHYPRNTREMTMIARQVEEFAQLYRSIEKIDFVKIARRAWNVTNILSMMSKPSMMNISVQTVHDNSKCHEKNRRPGTKRTIRDTEDDASSDDEVFCLLSAAYMDKSSDEEGDEPMDVD